jgi:hypothetical protein
MKPAVATKLCGGTSAPQSFVKSTLLYKQAGQIGMTV